MALIKRWKNALLVGTLLVTPNIVRHSWDWASSARDANNEEYSTHVRDVARGYSINSRDELMNSWNPFKSRMPKPYGQKVVKDIEVRTDVYSGDQISQLKEEGRKARNQ
jgi:hypothetical protein